MPVAKLFKGLVLDSARHKCDFTVEAQPLGHAHSVTADVAIRNGKSDRALFSTTNFGLMAGSSMRAFMAFKRVARAPRGSASALARLRFSALEALV